MKPRALTDLPMFFDDAHHALGEKLASIAATHDEALHAASSVIPRLAEHDLLRWLHPGSAPRVRALCLIRETLAYDSPLADSIFAVQGLAIQPISSGRFPFQSKVLGELEAGARVGAFALTEPDAGSDVAAMKSVARADGDHWVLDGEKVFISNVGIAHYFVVFANADPSLGKKGISAFLVESTAPGLALSSIGTSTNHPLGRLVMKGCRVPREHLLGEVGQGLMLALSTLETLRTSVGAAAVGMAQRALDETIARVKERRQFGQRLADFQLVQAALAEMKTELDASRLLVYRAAWWKDRSERAPEVVAMAKMYATEAAQRIIDRAVQLHGGLGVTVGNVVESLYREIRPLRIYEGTTEIQKLIIGASLVKETSPS